MNKNGIYLSVFAVLCVLVGVLAGASITRESVFPRGHEKARFVDRAERFMGQGPMEARGKKCSEGLFETFRVKLNLDGQQQVKVKEILEESRLEIDQIGRNVRLSLKQIKDRNDKQIMELLNHKQKEDFKNLIEEFEKKFAPMKANTKPTSKGEFRPQPGDEFFPHLKDKRYEE
jgi:hypothetical protein